MIFTFRRSNFLHKVMTKGKRYCAPAVNSVPANCAVFRNSSKSLSWVTDFKRVVESTSVVY
jgi:hypothetical protein